MWQHKNIEVRKIAEKRKGGRPGLPASLVFPFQGIPISLTEGG